MGVGIKESTTTDGQKAFKARSGYLDGPRWGGSLFVNSELLRYSSLRSIKRSPMLGARRIIHSCCCCGPNKK